MRLVLEMRGLQETFAHVSEVGGSGFVMLHSTRTSQSVLEDSKLSLTEVSKKAIATLLPMSQLLQGHHARREIRFMRGMYVSVRLQLPAGVHVVQNY